MGTVTNVQAVLINVIIKMAHRFNEQLGKVTPKPSARERTRYRWRMRHGLEEKRDKQRFEIHQGVISSIKDWISKHKGKQNG